MKIRLLTDCGPYKKGEEHEARWYDPQGSTYLAVIDNMGKPFGVHQHILLPSQYVVTMSDNLLEEPATPQMKTVEPEPRRLYLCTTVAMKTFYAVARSLDEAQALVEETWEHEWDYHASTFLLIRDPSSND